MQPASAGVEEVAVMGEDGFGNDRWWNVGMLVVGVLWLVVLAGARRGFSEPSSVLRPNRHLRWRRCAGAPTTGADQLDHRIQAIIA